MALQLPLGRGGTALLDRDTQHHPRLSLLHLHLPLRRRGDQLPQLPHTGIQPHRRQRPQHRRLPLRAAQRLPDVRPHRRHTPAVVCLPRHLPHRGHRPQDPGRQRNHLQLPAAPAQPHRAVPLPRVPQRRRLLPQALRLRQGTLQRVRHTLHRPEDCHEHPRRTGLCLEVLLQSLPHQHPGRHKRLPVRHLRIHRRRQGPLQD